MSDQEMGLYDDRVFIRGLVFDEKNLQLDIACNDHAYEYVKKSLHHLTALPKYSKGNPRHAVVPKTWAVVTQLARLCEKRGFQWEPQPDLNAWIIDEFTRRFAENGDLKFDISQLERTPMPHQAGGAFVGSLNRRFFFGDAAGTGKTMTALLTLADLDAQGKNPFPAFVVTPASVVDPWLEELEACFPDWTYTAYRGPRRKQLSSKYQVYVMSWDVFRLDMQPPQKAKCECGAQAEWNNRLQKALDNYLLLGGESKTDPPRCDEGHVFFPFDTSRTELPPLLEFTVPQTIVLDEAHALCNTDTKQSVAARRMARVAKYAFPMSGTPITKNIDGFWSALNVLDIQSFPSKDRFREQYCDTGKNHASGRDEVEGLTTENRDEFYTVMQGSMRRVAKQDVLKDLPDKTYVTRYVEIPKAYRAAYDEMEEDMIAHIPDTDEPLPVMSTLAQFQRLTQLASSACDVEIEMLPDEKKDSPTFGQEVPHYKVTMREPCWKVDELMQIMDESDGEPIVTFSPSAQLMGIAGDRAEKAGYKVGYVRGGQSAKNRTATRQAFQDGKLDLLCVTTSAGGVGLTLTRAHTAVMLQRPPAFWQADQSEDRLHRRGQSRGVTIIDVVAKDSVEYRIRQFLRTKAGNLADLVRDPRIVKGFLGGK